MRVRLCCFALFTYQAILKLHNYLFQLNECKKYLLYNSLYKDSDIHIYALNEKLKNDNWYTKAVVNKIIQFNNASTTSKNLKYNQS